METCRADSASSDFLKYPMTADISLLRKVRTA